MKTFTQIRPQRNDRAFPDVFLEVSRDAQNIVQITSYDNKGHSLACCTMEDLKEVAHLAEVLKSMSL